RAVRRPGGVELLARPEHEGGARSSCRRPVLPERAHELPARLGSRAETGTACDRRSRRDLLLAALRGRRRRLPALLRAHHDPADRALARRSETIRPSAAPRERGPRRRDPGDGRPRLDGATHTLRLERSRREGSTPMKYVYDFDERCDGGRALLGG